MKITGYRSLSTVHDWGRITGDVNGVQTGNTTPVPVLIIETDSGLEGVGLGAHGAGWALAQDGRLFAIDGDKMTLAYDAQSAAIAFGMSRDGSVANRSRLMLTA